MKYLRPELATLLLIYLLKLTDAQSACPDDQIRIYVLINKIRFTCCVPRAVRTVARCTKTGGYVTVTTTPPMTTLRLITKDQTFITRPIVTANILSTLKQTTTTNTPTMTTQTTQTTPTTITTIPETTTSGNDEDEGSGDETNLGNVGEGQDEPDSASTGLSIGIPLAVLAVVVAAVLLVRVRYKRKKEVNGDTNKLTANGRVFVKHPKGDNSAANDAEYQDFEQNVRTSPPQDTYDSLHLYGNTAETPHAYEQVPEKRDTLPYESLHVYSNSHMGQPDYDTPTSRVMYANLKVQFQT
ncbi:uncharacterized protein LOC110448428 [Mizuhopecten yessoensis]|uniref:Uncharacterized protein n=1 Tax=Mizuhopecten yessoensis TaxID=6573 RepID=A0A210QT59_MIZYE|nr:uncharacterized protein LOC110448428 [Mizuhopecten yessoensis]XP_021350332.1 uncharacterized protein LOC110448428 [Mizuhopecten yessoensis]OWF51937.1 hypothetical protein KP79_PYT18487 [Mizuhopecten yessoensis]